MPSTAFSLLVAALLFVSPDANLRYHSNDQSQDNRNRNESPHERTIRWAAEAMSPAADLTAAAAAAVIRRNVISGAAIFTVGDAAAQMLTSSKATTKTPSTTAVAPGGAEEGPERRAVARNCGRAASLNILPATVSSLDLNRLWSSTFLGAIWSGFCVPFIYGSVEKTFPGKANLRQILIKVLVTCSILSTIGNYVTMFARRFIAQYTTYQFDKSSSLRLKWWSNPIQSTRLFLAIFKGCFKSCNRDIREVIVDDLKIWPLYDLTCYSLIPPGWRPITTSIMSSGWAMYMSIVSAKEEQTEEDDGIDVSVDATASYFPSTTSPAIQVPAIAEPGQQEDKTIRVNPLENPFSSATSETTKRLLGVTGGSASDAIVPNKAANPNGQHKAQHPDNNDDDDQKTAA